MRTISSVVSVDLFLSFFDSSAIAFCCYIVLCCELLGSIVYLFVIFVVYLRKIAFFGYYSFICVIIIGCFLFLLLFLFWFLLCLYECYLLPSYVSLFSPVFVFVIELLLLSFTLSGILVVLCRWLSELITLTVADFPTQLYSLSSSFYF